MNREGRGFRPPRGHQEALVGVWGPSAPGQERSSKGHGHPAHSTGHFVVGNLKEAEPRGNRIID